MKNLICSYCMLLSFLSFGQVNEVPPYSQTVDFAVSPLSKNSKIGITKVYAKDESGIRIHREGAANLLNGELIRGLDLIPPELIESRKYAEGFLTIDGKKYYRKHSINLKDNYMPKLVSLEQLIAEHLKSMKGSYLIQIDGEKIYKEYDKYIIDPNYVLHLFVQNLPTSDKGNNINLIDITTKTKENIQMANKNKKF